MPRIAPFMRPDGAMMRYPGGLPTVFILPSLRLFILVHHFLFALPAFFVEPSRLAHVAYLADWCTICSIAHGHFEKMTQQGVESPKPERRVIRRRMVLARHVTSIVDDGVTGQSQLRTSLTQYRQCMSPVLRSVGMVVGNSIGRRTWCKSEFGAPETLECR
ncbi:hypothetical protein M011DRAFT_45785 [Sporormia fimetaria CBS 119925]|uniref:Uncharacterized protein n=1 Tax=Sporormia fimetaria CBS 119925 TaxID=1340428 RepID=A0A6A6VC90_9PLEO|nr:hypothetical protein M011DRAFT_45785 [Sporormia fimetaria CBS 119925]